MEKLTWKKVAHWDNKKLWRDIVDFMDAVWIAGYEYGLFKDGVIYSIDPQTGQVFDSGYVESDIE